MPANPAEYYNPLYPDITPLVAELHQGNRSAVEPIIYFLERDPYTFGSGYLKEKIWRYLLRIQLAEKQQELLRKVALHYVRHRISREFYPMCRFIRGISNEAFAQQVHKIQISHDGITKYRASILAAYLRSFSEGEQLRYSFWHCVLQHPNRKRDK